MIETMQAVRERRNALAKEARNLVDQNPGAQWTEEHGKKFDDLTDAIARVDAEMDRKQKVMDLDSDRALADAGVREVRIEGTPAQAVSKWLRFGERGMTDEDWIQGRPLMTPEDGGLRIRNTLSESTATQGVETVPTTIVDQITDALKQYGGVRDVAEIIQTATGNPINFPTSDGTAEVGELVAENAAASAADPSFGSVGLNVYKFSSKIVAVPFELLQDNIVNLEAWLGKRLATRLGRIQNTLFTTGTGTAQPRGVVTAAASGKVGLTGQTTSVIYDDLVDLQHSVDPAYRALGRCRWMLNDKSLAAIRKIKDTQGRPLFIPGYYDNGVAAGIPDTLLGAPFTINQDVEQMAANAKSILFGDFSFYKIRDVMGFTLFRFTDSAYAKNGQVGFLAWMRSGGNLVDTGSPVKYYQNSAT